MPVAVILAAAVVAAVVGVRAPLRIAFPLLVASDLLVPGNFVVPNGFSSLLTFGRIVLVAVGCNVVLRARRGEAPGLFRVTPMAVALVALFVVALLCGVAGAAATTPLGLTTTKAYGVADQVAFFVVALACCRGIDDPWATARAVAGVVLVSAAIAVVEHRTGGSWGELLNRRIVSQAGRSSSARGLEPRAGRLRVRAGTEFALQYGWVTVSLLPILGAAVSRARPPVRLLGAAAIGLVVLTVVWSYSRSSIAGLVIGPVLLFLCSGANRKVGAILLVGLALGLGVYLVDPALSSPLDRRIDPGSAIVRADRIPVVLDLTAGDPLTGLGLGSLASNGITQTDNSLLLTYAELGALGLVVLLIAVATGLAATIAAAVVARPDERLVAAACVGGFVCSVGSGLAFDSFSLLNSTRTCWLFVALAVAVGERSERWHRGPPLQRLSGWRLVTPAVALAVGLLVFVAAPRHATARYQVTTVAAGTASSTDNALYFAQESTSACVALRAELVGHPDLDATCSRGGWDGAVILRVQAADARRLGQVAAVVDPLLASQVVKDVTQIGATTRQASPVASTAPAWMLLAALALALLTPRRRPPATWPPAAGPVRVPVSAGV